MILGVGMVSLATLFPIGLQRMRDAARYSRTKILVDSVGSDGTARALLNPTSFGASAGNTVGLMDAINWQYGLPTWWWDPNTATPADWNPLIQDTAFYGDFPSSGLGVNVGTTGGYGLPFAYDPLWRYQTPPGSGAIPNDLSQNGYYLGDQFEARFGSGIGFIRLDPTDGGLPSAHGLQRHHEFQSSGGDLRDAGESDHQPDHADLEQRAQHLRVARGRGLGGPGGERVQSG